MFFPHPDRGDATTGCGAWIYRHIFCDPFFEFFFEARIIQQICIEFSSVVQWVVVSEPFVVVHLGLDAQ